MDDLARQDLRQSEEYGKYIKALGWKVEKLQIANCKLQIFIKKLGWLGAIAKIQRVRMPLPSEQVRKVLSENRVWMCKIEPVNTSPLTPLLISGEGKRFRQDGWPMLATRTIRIDLTQKDLLRSFKKDARYCLRKVQSAKCKVQKDDFVSFYNLWRRANGIRHLWTPPEKDYKALISSFGKKCFCVTIDGKAGALVLMHNRVAYYYYAGSLPEGKKLQLPYLVVWEAMQEAKKRGCKIWDFEGIYDPRWPNKSILGYSHFKQSFGGEVMELPGSFTKWGWW